MAAIAHNPAFAKKAGVPVSVGKHFSDADKGKKFKEGGFMKEPKESKAMADAEIKALKRGHASKDVLKHEREEHKAMGYKHGGKIQTKPTGYGMKETAGGRKAPHGKHSSEGDTKLKGFGMGSSTHAGHGRKVTKPKTAKDEMPTKGYAMKKGGRVPRKPKISPATLAAMLGGAGGPPPDMGAPPMGGPPPGMGAPPGMPGMKKGGNVIHHHHHYKKGGHIKVKRMADGGMSGGMPMPPTTTSGMGPGLGGMGSGAPAVPMDSGLIRGSSPGALGGMGGGVNGGPLPGGTAADQAGGIGGDMVPRGMGRHMGRGMGRGMGPGLGGMSGGMPMPPTTTSVSQAVAPPSLSAYASPLAMNAQSNSMYPAQQQAAVNSMGNPNAGLLMGRAVGYKKGGAIRREDGIAARGHTKGKIVKMASGGHVGSQASRRADGCASKGHTKGRVC